VAEGVTEGVVEGVAEVEGEAVGEGTGEIVVATDGVQPDTSKQATKAAISAGVGAMAFLPSVTSLGPESRRSGHPTSH